MQILCGAGFDETAIDDSALVSLLTHKSAVVRRWARERLTTIGRPVLDPLLDLCRDRRPHVRWEAVKTLAAIAAPETALALVDILENDDEFDVRWVAGDGLIAMGCPGVIQLLNALAARPESMTLQEGALHVCHHLSRRRTFRFVAPVLAALKSPEPAVALPSAVREALAEKEPLTFPEPVATLGAATH